MAGTDVRPLHLRRRTSRPQLKREPLGGRPDTGGRCCMLANLGRLLSLGMLSFFQALAQQPSLRRYLMTERPLNRLCIAIDTIHPARDSRSEEHTSELQSR